MIVPPIARAARAGGFWPGQTLGAAPQMCAVVWTGNQRQREYRLYSQVRYVEAGWRQVHRTCPIPGSGWTTLAGRRHAPVARTVSART